MLPTQRDKWPELQQIEALRGVEMDNDADLFRPWEEYVEQPSFAEAPIAWVFIILIFRTNAVKEII